MVQKRKKSIVLRLIVLGVCAYFMVTLASLWGTLNEKKAELNSLNNEYLSRLNDINELKALLESDSNVQIIEKAARERLGYIYSDEQIFIDISGN